MDRFLNRLDVWGKQWVSWDGTRHGYAYQAPDMDTKGGRFPYQPVTPGLVQQHFRGQITCAWPALDENNCSKWLCFDSDTSDGDLDILEEFLRKCGWHAIREGRRLGRAGHLWLLFDGPIPAAVLIVLADAMIGLAGVRPVSKEYPHGIERFPHYANKYSQVRGPLGINQKPDARGARGLFDGAEQNLRSQLEWLAVQPLNRAEDALRESETHKPETKLVADKSRSRRRDFSAKPGLFRILEFIDARPVGKELAAQCPLCALEGHDRHRNKLRIKPDGSTFCCV